MCLKYLISLFIQPKRLKKRIILRRKIYQAINGRPRVCAPLCSKDMKGKPFFYGAAYSLEGKCLSFLTEAPNRPIMLFAMGRCGINRSNSDRNLKKQGYNVFMALL
jgi:hypothetical protein